MDRNSDYIIARLENLRLQQREEALPLISLPSIPQLTLPASAKPKEPLGVEVARTFQIQPRLKNK